MSSISEKLHEAIYRHRIMHNGERPFALRISHEELYELLYTPLGGPLNHGELTFCGVPIQVGGPFEPGAYVERGEQK